ncbi:MAG: hypothetical protein U0637_03745 [Phycisphaerales bacterium]
MTAQPGQRVEWRLDVVYTGTRTDLFALGEVLFQPTVENADNIDAGDGVDAFGPWCVVGPCDMPPEICYPLSQTSARSGDPLARYGKVDFGGNPTSWPGGNQLTLFRHSQGSGGAPPGEWMRIAGASAMNWPLPLSCPPRPEEINLILHGVSSIQQSQALAPSHHVSGTAPVVFRDALQLSMSPFARTITLSTFRTSLGRPVGITSCDDRRYISWQAGSADSGSWRTLEPAISPAYIFITGNACDFIDYNRDTLFPDTQDIADFLTVFSGAPCPTSECADLDFNNDGVAPDTGDIEALLSVFAGGPCT